jgi:hypothetical protein
MARQDLTTLSVEELESALKGKRTLLRTVIGIFGLIVAAWIVLGLWRENTPVFISTVAVSVFVTVAAWTASRGLEEELRRRRGGHD